MSGRPDWQTMPRDERDRLLHELAVDQGLSAAQIAARFTNASRNAVIGRIHRAAQRGQKVVLAKRSSAKGRLAAPSGAAAPAFVAEPASVFVADRAPVRGGNVPQLPMRKPKQAAKVRPPIDFDVKEIRKRAFDPLSGQEPVHLESLKRNSCRWPVSGYLGRAPLMCGASLAPDSVYCGVHTALAYHPLRTRRTEEGTALARTAKILEGRNRANDSEAASFVERFEELEANVLKRRMSFLEDCRKIRHEQKELLDDAKSQGVAKQVVRSVVRARALQTNITALEENLEDDDRQLFKGIRDVLGDYGDTPLGQAAIDSEEGQQDATTAAVVDAVKGSMTPQEWDAAGPAPGAA